jgi:NAD(P) transhydrogenase subunit alpha
MSDINQIVNNASIVADKAAELSGMAANLAEDAMNAQPQEIISTVATVAAVTEVGVDPFIFAVTVFVLACFVGYYVVWKVTPALHTPLMSVTNAISSIIIVGAILAIGNSDDVTSSIFGVIAIFIASINIFGGFIVTQRMLQMFRKK